ncbi:hypothetical protein QVD17_31161 [Tagetes erecta]|uniref:Uncharacterized protein n=1 Tax=Tagetes erecta TaxID=13708 RepID=A0AAD8NGR4_TARER|nr:hypothetical protein QVD17_31161 [Tagetes erecta]
MASASSLRFVTSKLLTRSLLRFRPTTSPFHTIIAAYSTMPKHELVYDQSWPRSMWPEISSMSFDMLITDGEAWLSLHAPELDPPLPGPNVNEMRASVIKSPDKITGSEFKEEMKDGTSEPVGGGRDEYTDADIDGIREEWLCFEATFYVGTLRELLEQLAAESTLGATWHSNCFTRLQSS